MIGGYVVDFYCPALRLAIELDGGVHDERVDYDAARDAQLGMLGVTVVRFSNESVLRQPSAVLEAIERAISRLAPLPPEYGGKGLGEGGLTGG